MTTVSDLQNEINELRTLLRKHINDSYSLNYDQLLHVSSPTIANVFMRHLSIACSKIEEPPQGFGRKRKAMKNIIFNLAVMIYFNLSSRQALFYVNKALEVGYTSEAIKHNTLSRYLCDQSTTQCLQALLNTGYTSDNKDLLMILCKHVEREMDKEIEKEA